MMLREGSFVNLLDRDKQISRGVITLEPRVMFALPPKADMAQHDRDVRFVPKADIAHFYSIHLVGECDHLRRELVMSVR